jgi:hypothetical protein
MATRSAYYGRYVAPLLAFIIFSSVAIATNAQKLKLGIRSGVSLANYTGHDASGPDGPVPANPITSYYDLDGTRTGGSYFELPNPYYKTSITKDLRTGFYAGVFLDIKLNKRFVLEPGVSYVQKGIDMDFNITSTEGLATRSYRHVRSIKTNYISIPIVVRYYLGQKERFYVTAGVYDAFAVKTQIKNATTRNSIAWGRDLPSSYTSSFMQWSEIKTRVVDCGLVGGAGFNLPLSARLSVGIDARVNVGLVNINGDSSKSSYVSFSTSAKNINLETGLRVGYALSAL